jgi:DNA-binding NarL/FixJ family response regulator
VVLVDDHIMVREAIRGVLTQSGDITVVAETGDPDEACRLAAALKPDAIVLDVRLPKTSGIEVTRQLVERDPEARILIMSSHSWDECGDACFAAGASGFICKDRPFSELIEAVRSVARGDGYLQERMTPDLLRKILRRRSERSTQPGPLSALSAREAEVFTLLMEGLQNKEIASRLRLSPRTVETHRAHIMKKLGVTSIAQLVRLGIQTGMMSNFVAPPVR